MAMKPEDDARSVDESAYIASVRRATLWLGFLYWFVEFLISSILWAILGIDPIMYAEIFQGSLSTVGQAKTASPWGTLDQGGNVVEWTDTITPSPTPGDKRVWRRLHGGIANAPAYQLWLSAVGLQPQDNAAISAVYPWIGLRIGVLGNLKPRG